LSVFFSPPALLDAAGELDESLTEAEVESDDEDEEAPGAADALVDGALADEVVELPALFFLLSPQAAKSMVLETTTAANRIPLVMRTVPPLPGTGATVSRYGVATLWRRCPP
jgi:hypothetical protein